MIEQTTVKKSSFYVYKSGSAPLKDKSFKQKHEVHLFADFVNHSPVLPDVNT